MQRDMFRQWIRNIFATQEDEIDCGQLFEMLSQFVDMEISGEDAARLLPYVHQHLQQCPECEELHQVIHDIAHLEEEDKLPDIDEVMADILSIGQER